MKERLPAYAVNDARLQQLLRIPEEDLPLLIAYMPLNLSDRNREEIERLSQGVIEVPTWGESVTMFN